MLFPHIAKSVPHNSKTTRHLRENTSNVFFLVSNIILALLGALIFRKLQRWENWLYVVSKASRRIRRTCTKYTCSPPEATTCAHRKGLPHARKFWCEQKKFCPERTSSLPRTEKILLRSEIILMRQEKVLIRVGKFGSSDFWSDRFKLLSINI